MKTFLLLFVLISSLWSAKIDEFANKYSYYRAYDLALSIAKKEDKMVMLVMVADFCPWCKKFERKTLQNELVSKLVKQHFIPVIVDNYRDEGSYPKELSTSRLPTTYIIDSKTQKVIQKSTLYVNKNDFLVTIQQAINIDKANK